MRSYTTRGKLSIGIHIVTVLAQDNIKLYFPPSKKSTDQIPDWTVSVGDLINVTWTVSWPNPGLLVQSYATNSNFTKQTTGTGWNYGSTPFTPYIIKPEDYGVDDPSTKIQAYFCLLNQDNVTQYIESQNFTIVQHQLNSGISASLLIQASTWTGSVTLISSANSFTAITAPLAAMTTTDTFTTTQPPSARPSSTNSDTETTTKRSTTSTIQPGSTGTLRSAVTPTFVLTSSSTANPTPLPSSDTTSKGTKSGIITGGVLGFCILLALITIAVLLARRTKAGKLKLASTLSSSCAGSSRRESRVGSLTEVDGSSEAESKKPELDGVGLLELGQTG